MFEAIYQIAETRFKIRSFYPLFSLKAKDYLCEGDAFDALISYPHEEIVEFQRNDEHEPTIEVAEFTLLLRKVTEILFAKDVLFFHASSFMIDGMAFAVTAKSGTGKSTHARLLKEHYGERFSYINDDKPFVLVKENNITLFSSPWLGKHDLGGNLSAPLKGIFLLERGSLNTAKEEKGLSIVDALSYQFFYPGQEREERKKAFYLTLKLMNEVPVYRLSVDMSENAVEASSSVIETILERDKM